MNKMRLSPPTNLGRPGTESRPDDREGEKWKYRWRGKAILVTHSSTKYQTSVKNAGEGERA